jgi:DNA (cytosine-5)-methyltransferase 1
MAIRYLDLFCGVGGFRLGAERALAERNLDGACVFSSDVDEACRDSYEANFGERPAGDIAAVPSDDIPDHDVLFAGFPCQPFSIIGKGRGFEDARGTLFFAIARILEARRPSAFLLENVKRLVGHDGGRTLGRILETLRELGYRVDHRVLNALDYGLPQKRERVFIVGFLDDVPFDWPPARAERAPLADLLEKRVDKRYYASEAIRAKRKAAHKPAETPSIWHENKSGNVSSYPYSCALRAGASYNYLLVNGERRLTPREMFRLQGFPDSYNIVAPDWRARAQAGNAVPAPVVAAVFGRMLDVLEERAPATEAALDAEPSANEA